MAMDISFPDDYVDSRAVANRGFCEEGPSERGLSFFPFPSLLYFRSLFVLFIFSSIYPYSLSILIPHSFTFSTVLSPFCSSPPVSFMMRPSDLHLRGLGNATRSPARSGAEPRPQRYFCDILNLCLISCRRREGATMAPVSPLLNPPVLQIALQRQQANQSINQSIDQSIDRSIIRKMGLKTSFENRGKPMAKINQSEAV